MELIVDLHIHSKYSRTTSKDMDLQHIYYWGELKGIGVIGTGDIAYPVWFQLVSQQLEKVENGLYQLKPTYAQRMDAELPASVVHRSGINPKTY